MAKRDMAALVRMWARLVDNMVGGERGGAGPSLVCIPSWKVTIEGHLAYEVELLWTFTSKLGLFDIQGNFSGCSQPSYVPSVLRSIGRNAL